MAIGAVSSGADRRVIQELEDLFREHYSDAEIERPTEN